MSFIKLMMSYKVDDVSYKLDDVSYKVDESCSIEKLSKPMGRTYRTRCKRDDVGEEGST